MKMKRTILIVALLAVIPALSGCWYVVAGGAGGVEIVPSEQGSATRAEMMALAGIERARAAGPR